MDDLQTLRNKYGEGLKLTIYGETPSFQENLVQAFPGIEKLNNPQNGETVYQLRNSNEQKLGRIYKILTDFKNERQLFQNFQIQQCTLE